MARARRLATLMVLVSSLGLLFAGPAAAVGPARSGLTAQQERVVLHLIDDICGDTWCEGDFAFDFRRLSCEPAERSCELRLRIAPVGEPLRWRWRSGEVEGFARFRQMVDTSATGRQSLNGDFYLAVSDLIARIEATVPAAEPVQVRGAYMITATPTRQTSAPPRS